MSSTKSKAKTTNVNSEEDQLSLKDLLERMDAMNLLQLQNKEENREIGEKFVLFEKKFTDLQESLFKTGMPNSEKQVFVIDEKPEGPTKVANGLEYSELPFKHNENFADIKPMIELKKEDLGKFIFSKVLSKSPATIFMRISDSKCWGNYAAVNQYVRGNPACIPGDYYFLPNLFIYWAEENIAEANCEGFFFFKILLLFFFDALALRVIRFTDFLYLYTMYWDIQ